VTVSTFRSYKSLKIGFHTKSADRPLYLASSTQQRYNPSPGTSNRGSWSTCFKYHHFKSPQLTSLSYLQL